MTGDRGKQKSMPDVDIHPRWVPDLLEERKAIRGEISKPLSQTAEDTIRLNRRKKLIRFVNETLVQQRG